ncbi:unnamed protein product [Phytomonas sp. Hart1]|nr:unnamed protein product [Phytomonas sp. Hart1]|eukprot:CCW66444.1 unnamed protein product [Phytomonas sp. isolate Hart1]
MQLNQRKLISERHALLVYLQQLTASGSPIEQNRLIKKISGIDPRISEEYLPQIVHASFVHPSTTVREMLRNIILSLVGASLYVALRVSWLTISNFSSFESSDMAESVKQFQDSVESYAINRVMNEKGSVGPSPLSEVTEPIFDPSHVLQKEFRLKIYNDEHWFVNTLTNLGSQLCHLADRKRRSGELQKCLLYLNERIHYMRLIHPIGSSTDPVRWIVNIVVDECVVFSSRERAPYLIRYEVLVDDTATMQNPAQSQMRLPDGRFKVRPTSDEIFLPESLVHSGMERGSTMPSPQSCNAKLKSPAVELRHAEEKSADSDISLAKCFGETLEKLKARIRPTSPWGAHPKWDMHAMIVKAGDDLRQEELAMQLIYTISTIWKECGLTCAVHPYHVMPTNVQCGLLEVIDDAKSIDNLKKTCQSYSLSHIFNAVFGGPDLAVYLLAQRNFVESMAGYSVISYILQLRDRHNGNLMLSLNGGLIHIDFGFLLMTSPGGLNFESAPFKLSQELIETMGGQGSDAYGYYKVLIFQALNAVREFSDDIIALISLMVPKTTLPCLGGDPRAALSRIRGRLRFDLTSEVDYALYASDLIASSADNWRTRRYDQFQTLQNGIW